MVTYFVADLRCPECASETHVEMYTKLLDDPGTVVLRVHDAVPADPVDYDKAFLKLREPAPGEPFGVFLPWLCKHCGWGDWALVQIADERVLAIDAVALDRASLARAQFISEDMDGYFEMLTGEEIYVEDESGRFRVRADFLALLERHLPEPPRRAPSCQGYI